MASGLKLDDAPLSDQAVSATADAGAEEISGRDRLLRKKRRTQTVTINVGPGPEDTVELTMVALTQKELDDVQAKHPPRRGKGEEAEQDRRNGFNGETFPPALLAATVTDPKLSEDEWSELRSSDEWSPGESAHIFDLAISLTTSGFNVNFGVRG